jgi:hypothetical protein
MTRRICSMDDKSGDNPPCIVKIFSSMIAAMGRQLKQSVNVFHNLILYRRLPRLIISRGGTFVIEAVDSVDTGAFMVTAENEEVFGVLDFICEEKTYCF